MHCRLIIYKLFLVFNLFLHSSSFYFSWFNILTLKKVILKKIYLPKQDGNPLSEFNLNESQVEVASDYHKKKYTFRIKLCNGCEYLINTKSADEMSLWIQNIRGSAVDSNVTDEEFRKRLATINSPPHPSSVSNPQEEVQNKKEKEKKKSSSSLFKIRKVNKTEKP